MPKIVSTSAAHTAWKAFGCKLSCLAYLCAAWANGCASAEQHEANTDIVNSVKEDLTQRLVDLKTLREQGLTSIADETTYTNELRELETLSKLNTASPALRKQTAETITSKLKIATEDLRVKSELWEQGLVATVEYESAKDKVALYKHILQNLQDGYYAYSGDGSLRLEDIFHRRHPITSRFGFRNDPLNPNRRQFHAGIDIAAPYGSPIYSPLPGRVRFVGLDANSPGGMRVHLDHAEGLSTAYLHLSKVTVTRGQSILAGQEIGCVGDTGTRVTGAHLHLEVHVKGLPIDPERVNTSNK